MTMGNEYPTAQAAAHDATPRLKKFPSFIQDDSPYFEAMVQAFECEGRWEETPIIHLID